MGCKIQKLCVVCSSPFMVFPSMSNRFVTCSKKCVRKHKEGSSNGNWRGGIGKYRAAEIHTGLYKRWRSAVFERDGHKCVLCSSVNNLQADHIKPWALYPSLRYEVSNGRTLCYPCHKKTIKQFYIERAILESSGYIRPKPCRNPILLICRECRHVFVRQSSRDKFCSKRCQRRDGSRRWRRLHYKSGELRIQ